MNNILNILLKHYNQFISGNEFAKQLGISRSAVNKSINKLRKAGYPIHASTKKGYCLLNNDILTESQIQSFLTYTHSVEVLESIPSTNTYLKNNPIENHIVIAKTQTNGRGRLNRSFYSEKDHGLYFSFCIKPNCTIYESLQYTILASVAVYNAVKKLYDIDLHLKWVNDLIYHNKKVGGILCEGEIEVNSQYLNYLIIGIGININVHQFPNELNSIAENLNIQINRNALIAEIINQFDYYFINQAPFIDIYRSRSNVLNKEVNIITSKESYIASVIDIKDNGFLVVKKDNQIIELNSGEITLRVR